MSLRLTNTFSRKKESFTPLKKDHISLYTCGPTVYDFAHIGNFRAYVFEDVLRRYFEFKHYRVKHVMNFTDVDDKTIAGAAAQGKPLREFTEPYIKAFLQDLETLNILKAAQQPRATEEIGGMIHLVETLVQKDAAYLSEGSVYFRVDSFAPYGRLSGKSLEKGEKRSRIDHDEYGKEEANDFALWKKAKEGEPSWDSPWGKGRPGWHLECSVMSMKYLGSTLDIHAGGEDLIFPHHENEIAQSEAATGKKFVRYWLHCKHLLINGEKMSKSKGNYYTLRDLVRLGHDPMAIRCALLSVHYRQQLNFTLEGLKEAGEAIKKLDECYWKCLSIVMLTQKKETSLASRSDFDQHAKLSKCVADMVTAMEDDLNVSVALAKLFEGLGEINSWFAKERAVPEKDLCAAIYFFKQVDLLLGFDISKSDSVPNEIIDALSQIIDSRRQKDFAKADSLRQKMNMMGWFVKDARPGEPSTVKKKLRAWDQ